MKDQKRMVSLFSALLLCLTLAACDPGGQNPASQSPAGSSGSQTMEETQTSQSLEAESAPEPETAPTASSSLETPEANRVLSVEELAFPVGQQVSGAFTGNAYLEPMIMNDDIYNFPQTNNIVFEPGARSYWHTHGGMVLIGTGGSGYYQEEGKPAQIIREGDVVQCPEGVLHWHGAAPDSWFSQIVIYDSQYVPPEDAPASREVTDEEYKNLEVAGYTPQVSADNGFMFQRAEQAMVSDTFSGPAYVSEILSGENVAGVPSLHYVVFAPGVINNWHTHEGGQILIATDGIGYHQIEGQPVEVLYPGDVALCPPGEKHWHGGSADTSFAHIAVNTNPELTGLEWFDRLSAEEYAQLADLPGESSNMKTDD